MILECRKDSVREMIFEKISTFTGTTQFENATYQNLTDSNYGSVATTNKPKRYGL